MAAAATTERSPGWRVGYPSAPSPAPPAGSRSAVETVFSRLIHRLDFEVRFLAEIYTHLVSSDSGQGGRGRASYPGSQVTLPQERPFETSMSCFS